MNRRDLLKLAASGCLTLAAPPPALPAIEASGLKPGDLFSHDALITYARALAGQPYQAPDTALPEGLQDMDYQKYAAIRFDENRAIWLSQPHGFVVEPLHRGFIYNAPVDLFTVEDGRVLLVPYDPGLFDFGEIGPPAGDADLGFSGFRLKAPFISPDRLDEFALFQGASYLRAVARSQTYGPLARGLAINTGEPEGEQFPFFRSFWIERPELGSKKLTVHALLDSEGATGAFRLVIEPGGTTTMDVEARLFPRVKIEHIGIAPLTSMYFFGPNDREGVDDIRLAVHKSAGLQILSEAGEWIWRPLQNPKTLQVSALTQRSPKGYGLLQRNRDVAAFEDDLHRYERVPSVWVEPKSDWGEGSVHLVEIPSEAEIHDNIVSYWRPKDPLEAGSEHIFAYRLSWLWSLRDFPSELAVAHETRTGAGEEKSRRFAVDFIGDIFTDGKQAQGIVPAITASLGKIRDVSYTTDPARRLARMSFLLDPKDETYSELRAVLMQGDKAISETWLYRWTP